MKKLKKFEVILPIFSALLAVLSFVCGGLFSVWETNQNEMNTRAGQWRTAVQSVGMDEQSLARSAFLLFSFDLPQSNDDANSFWESIRQHLGGAADDGSYKSQARKVEVEMMDRTNQPETFDLIFSNMLSGTSANVPDDLEVFFDLQGKLIEHLETLCEVSKKNLSTESCVGKQLETFISDPIPFFDKADHERLNETLIVLWKLDTLSNGMYCVWTDLSNPECPHYSGEPQGTRDMLLVNWQIPNGRDNYPGFNVIHTCQVHHPFQEHDYMCVN
jgi:hypothetical protein